MLSSPRNCIVIFVSLMLILWDSSQSSVLCQSNPTEPQHYIRWEPLLPSQLPNDFKNEIVDLIILPSGKQFGLRYVNEDGDIFQATCYAGDYNLYKDLVGEWIGNPRAILCPDKDKIIIDFFSADSMSQGVISHGLVFSIFANDKIDIDPGTFEISISVLNKEALIHSYNGTAENVKSGNYFGLPTGLHVTSFSIRRIPSINATTKDFLFGSFSEGIPTTKDGVDLLTGFASYGHVVSVDGQ